MRIAVNSRIYTEKNTGIPYYIKTLYSHILNIDKTNTYLFFQTTRSKCLGDTYTFQFLDNTLGKILFDMFFVVFLIKKHRIDLFHGPSNILPLIKPRGVKYVLTVHDLTFLLMPELYHPLFTLYYKYAVKRSLHIADVVLADSENTKEDILKHYGTDPAKIKVLYPGSNETFLKNIMGGESLYKFKYFFTLATHEKRKNISTILKVMGAHSDSFQGLKFIIIGRISDENRSKLTSIIETYKLSERVILYDYVSEAELQRLYTYAEFFIYPSLYEGFGLPVVDAMACGCIPAVSDNSSLREIVRNKSLRFDPRDVESIWGVISCILNLSRESRSKLARTQQSDAQRFNWEQAAKSFIQLYDSYAFV